MLYAFTNLQYFNPVSTVMKKPVGKLKMMNVMKKIMFSKDQYDSI